MPTIADFARFDGPWPKLPALGSREVHLWLIELSIAAESTRAMEAWLSDEQRERSTRFRFPVHRRRFTASWAATRRLLGAYSNRSPRDLQFVTGAKGKPHLEASPLHFNLTHSHDVALLAVSEAAPVGVDVERKRPMESADSIVRRYFSPGERDEYLRLPESERPDAFFRCWTRKEAVVKAEGRGMFASLGTLEVSLRPDQSAQVQAIDGSARDAAEWTVVDVEPARGFQGALATTAKQPEISAWRFDLDSAALDAEMEAEEEENGQGE